MTPPVPAAQANPDANPLAIVVELGVQERAVLAVLVAHRGRVTSRRELSRQAGLADLSVRRCDSVLVDLRRNLGRDAIITVRSRGWMLADAARPGAAALL